MNKKELPSKEKFLLKTFYLIQKNQTNTESGLVLKDGNATLEFLCDLF